jgi:glycosyltransferase involved in cell wall biosynthesis
MQADVVIEHLSKIPCGIPWFIGKRPFIAHCPHLFRKAIFQEVSWPLGIYVWLAESLIPFVYRKSPFWALSQSTAAELQKLGIESGMIEVISGGVNTNDSPTDLAPTPYPTLIYVGRIKKYKGLIEPLLTSWQQILQIHPEAQLIIVGKGDCERTLQTEVESRGLQDSVKLKGYVDETEKLSLLRSAWLLVYPSAKEGWGLPVIEAGLMGIPTVASDSSGLKDSVRHGETGILVPHGDSEALAKAILQLIASSEDRQRMGMNAKVWGRQFGWDQVADKVLQFIDKTFPGLGETKETTH